MTVKSFIWICVIYVLCFIRELPPIKEPKTLFAKIVNIVANVVISATLGYWVGTGIRMLWLQS